MDGENLPYQALVYYIHRSHDHKLCNGVIISQNHILTSDWCVHYSYEFELRVGVGSLKDHEKFYVNKIHLLSDVNSSENNIAILALDKSLIFSESIRLIKLVQNNEIIPDLAKMTVSSWGQINTVNEDKLQHLDVRYISYSDCSNVYDMYLYESEFCGIHVENSTNLCISDMGSPLVANDTLYGVVSFGFTCSNTYYIDIYTNILYSREWIREIAGI